MNFILLAFCQIVLIVLKLQEDKIFGGTGKMNLVLLAFCQIVLIGLKLCGIINDSWWGVLIPLICFVAISVIYIVYYFLRRWLSNAVIKGT